MLLNAWSFETFVVRCALAMRLLYFANRPSLMLSFLVLCATQPVKPQVEIEPSVRKKGKLAEKNKKKCGQLLDL